MKTLKVIALRYVQNGHALYQFQLDGKQIPEVAAVSQLHRQDLVNQGGGLAGYQRLESLSHVAEIRAYVESAGSMIPNSLCVAFLNKNKGRELRFRPFSKELPNVGVLEVPCGPDRAGFIVDGQQRAAALREADVAEFPMAIVAFTADEQRQKEHFVRVNLQKPLPRTLINELVPGIESALSAAHEKARLKFELVQRLNADADSPFRGLIKIHTNPAGVIQDSTIAQMLQSSLTDGVLYAVIKDHDGDVELMLKIQKEYWTAVATVWQKAWNAPRKHSKLTQKSALIAMGFVLEMIVDFRKPTQLTPGLYMTGLEKLRPHCHWDSGEWDLGPDGKLHWLKLQSTMSSVRLLTDHMVRTFKGIKRAEADAA